MSGNDFEGLFQKYLADRMTQDEFLRWKQLLQDETYSQRLEAQLEALVNEDQSASGMDAPEEMMYRQISTAFRPKQRTLQMRRFYWSAAAAVVLLAGVGLYVQYLKNGKLNASTAPLVVDASMDAVPGSSGAVLTLANGKTIVLDSLQNGVVALENNNTAVLENGSLRYEPQGPASGETALNTVATSRGKQFQLLLPDGTRAWLNAASSLTYPTRFSGAERLVQVTGEVFFDVARDRNKPFRVQAPANTFIEVTGTRFNVNAYPDEPAITTTLTQGAVNLRASGRLQPIRPGQQARIEEGRISVNDQADTAQVLAWKNGVFDMNNAELPTVMRQLARWYDVDIVYEKQPSSIRFGGKMQRNLRLSQVLNGMAGMGVQFRIDAGRKLVVY